MGMTNSPFIAGLKPGHLSGSTWWKQLSSNLICLWLYLLCYKEGKSSGQAQVSDSMFFALCKIPLRNRSQSYYKHAAYAVAHSGVLTAVAALVNESQNQGQADPWGTALAHIWGHVTAYLFLWT